MGAVQHALLATREFQCRSKNRIVLKHLNQHIIFCLTQSLQCSPTQASAERIVEYWKMRLAVFRDKAFCPFILGEHGAFTKEDEMALEVGVYRLFDGNADNGGRGIMYSQQRNHKGHSYLDEMAFVRAWWYLIHTACNNPSIQDHGLVYVVDPRNAKLSRFDAEVVPRMLKAIHLFPITLHSIHFCHPGIYFDSLYSSLAAIKEPGISLHSHIGSVEDVAGRLEQFGIPKRSIPRDLGGELDLEEYTRAWIGYRRSKSL